MGESGDSINRKTLAAPASREWLADLVHRYTDLVYAAAARRVADPHLAEDVTQAVFLILAQQPHKAARSAKRAGSLVGWLLKTTRYAAANALKRQRRRIYHEQRAAGAQGDYAMMPRKTSLAAALAGGAIASSDPSEVLSWREIAPMLDDAVLALSIADRKAIVMRYYEARSTAEIAGALGIRQDAVRQRLSRAIEKLRRKLESKGASLSAAVLAGLMGAHLVKAAPAHLVTACLSTLTGSAAATASAAAIAKGAMAMSYSLKATAGTMVVAAGMVAGVMALAGGDGEIVGAKAAAVPPFVAPQKAPASQPTTKPLTAAEIDAAVLPVSDEVIERTLIVGRKGEGEIDLDTGTTYGPKHFDGENMIDQAIDATASMSYPTPGLRGIGLIAKPVLNDLWEKGPSSEEIRRLWFNTPGGGEGEWIDAIGQLPRSFLYRTDEGAAGILQVVEVLEDDDQQAAGIWLRYKVLARGDGRTLREQAANVAKKSWPDAASKRSGPIMKAMIQVHSYRMKHDMWPDRWPEDLRVVQEFAGDEWPAEFPATAVYAPPRLDPRAPRGVLPVIFEAIRLPPPDGAENSFVIVGMEDGSARMVADLEELAGLLRRAGIEPPATQPAQPAAPK